MSEALTLLAILIGACLYGGGIVTGVWLSHVVRDGFPKVRLPARKPRVSHRPVEEEPLPPTPSVHPPPAAQYELVEAPLNGESTPFRYGARTAEESADNFEKMQAALERLHANPYGDAYNAGL